MYSVKLIVLAVNYLPAFSFFHYCVLLNNCEVSFLRHFSISLIITFHDLYDAFNYVIFFVSYISHCARSYLLMVYVKRISTCAAHIQCIFLSGSCSHIKTRAHTYTHTRTHYTYISLYIHIESLSQGLSGTGFLSVSLWTVLAKLSGH